MGPDPANADSGHGIPRVIWIGSNLPCLVLGLLCGYALLVFWCRRHRAAIARRHDVNSGTAEFPLYCHDCGRARRNTWVVTKVAPLTRRPGVTGSRTKHCNCSNAASCNLACRPDTSSTSVRARSPEKRWFWIQNAIAKQTRFPLDLG